jgi:hypothetical protein
MASAFRFAAAEKPAAEHAPQLSGEDVFNFDESE